MVDHALQELNKAIGEENVHLSDDERFRASLDNLRLSFLPDAVITPPDTDAICELLRLANRHGIPVTTRGGGTAATGAASPVKGGWVLDLANWNDFEIDTQSGFVHTGPGATPYAINQAAEAQGWFYPPDPSSLKYATIGGTIATNAGGMRGAKYGVTRDYVLALHACLPNGDFVRLGAPLRKFSAGYNLRDLLIGSEGTLAIITRATLRLLPRPDTRRVLLAGFPNATQALRATQELLRARIIPSILEFLDEQTTACHFARTKQPIFPEWNDSAPALLLLELDGPRSLVEDNFRTVRDCLSRDAFALREAANESEIESFFQLRRTCSQAMYELGNAKLNEDVVVPVDAYLDLLEFTLDLKDEIHLPTPTFGHAGDGNFHVHIMFDRTDKAQQKRAEEGIFRIMRKVVELGGAISGEHGIGLAKSPFLHLQHNSAEIQAMQSIKNALDPNGILNPGKIFEPVNVWDYEPTKVKLPWDH